MRAAVRLISLPTPSVSHAWEWLLPVPLAAFRPAAVDAGEAAGFLDQPGLATFRAERPEHRFGSAGCTADLVLCDRRGGYFQETGGDHFGPEELPRCGDQRRRIAAIGPLAATRIEYLLQLVGYKGHIPAAPEDGADHAGECHDPRIMLEVLRVDEDLEWAQNPVGLDIVDGHIECVLAVRPAQLVGGASELLRTDEQAHRRLDGCWARCRGLDPVGFELWAKRSFACRVRRSRSERREDRSSDRVGPVGR